MKLMIEILSFALVSALVLVSHESYAKDTEALCYTPQKRQGFLIKPNAESGQLVKLLETGNQRFIASVKVDRTKRQGPGITHYLKHEGKKYILHIERWDQFSEVEDYVVIKTAQGHEITYPLECHKS